MFLSAGEYAPPDGPVDSVEPENSAKTMSTRRITFKRPPNPLDRAEPPKRTRVCSFSLDKETIPPICSNPDPETAFAEQRRELVEAKRQGTQYICQALCGRFGIASRNLTVCTDENALGCDVQGLMVN